MRRNIRKWAERLVGALTLVVACGLVASWAYNIWEDTREKTCSDFDSQQDAQAYYAGLDPYGSHPLDEDADGMACEELARREPTREEFAAGWCDRTPEAPAPIAFVGTVRSVAADTEYYRLVTFDVIDWFTTDRGSEMTLAVFVNWSADNTDINGPWPIDLHNDWLVATADSPDPGEVGEMFACASEPLSAEARQRWDERYEDG